MIYLGFNFHRSGSIYSFLFSMIRFQFGPNSRKKRVLRTYKPQIHDKLGLLDYIFLNKKHNLTSFFSYFFRTVFVHICHIK
jgi:hypothetical protein